MRLLLPSLMTLLLGAAAPAESAEVEATWSSPPPVAPEMLVWHRGYSRQINPVLAAWNRMLHRLRGDLPNVFDRQCGGLVASLEGLDESLLLPVPDRLIDLYLRRLLLHLRGAALACSRGELYNVVYRLDEAGKMMADLRWLLRQRGLGGRGD